ncbi:unnamed protein product [Caenorhabditis angaria]|uniref:Uncharacterized protein n=1 Tax=Caenorhabditis angaria TaxID=860376 RepID=A0A9P1IMM5_9PELO|nr:unnamed protein product [Caenorhabditis angaria]
MTNEGGKFAEAYQFFDSTIFRYTFVENRISLNLDQFLIQIFLEKQFQPGKFVNLSIVDDIYRLNYRNEETGLRTLIHIAKWRLEIVLIAVHKIQT